MDIDIHLARANLVAESICDELATTHFGVGGSCASNARFLENVEDDSGVEVTGLWAWTVEVRGRSINGEQEIPSKNIETRRSSYRAGTLEV